MRIDDNFMNDVGLADMPAEEKQAFMSYAEEELETRVGQNIGHGLSESQLSEFNNIADDAEATLWLEEHVPTFREIVHNVFDNFKQELLDERLRILGVEPD